MQEKRPCIFIQKRIEQSATALTTDITTTTTTTNTSNVTKQLCSASFQVMYHYCTEKEQQKRKSERQMERAWTREWNRAQWERARSSSSNSIKWLGRQIQQHERNIFKIICKQYSQNYRKKKREYKQFNDNMNGVQNMM